MTTYFAPTREIEFVINELAGAEHINRLPGYEEATPDLISAVLEEAARFSTKVLAPLNKTGDIEGSRLVDGKVITPEGFDDAYRQFIAAGWTGLNHSPDYGGQGLPHLVNAAVNEMWNAANLSFSLCLY